MSADTGPWLYAVRCANYTSGNHMHSQAEVLERIRSTLVELFELYPDRITPEARLFEDPEIDRSTWWT